ncbi:MAG: ATP-binding cassette domain-containing protein [Phycisphaerales bacterium]|jgi:ABC-type glutathione transport system ATPase component|nr:ATP-binding cassette domain-containing protein [Phycisphaerales bacterium]
MVHGDAAPNFLPSGASSALLSVRDLRTQFPVRSGVLQRVTGHVKAVDGVSFDVAPGETLGLVGESGCGKTTVGRTILRLIPQGGARVSGSVRFAGEDVLAASGEALRTIRRNMQIVFQDPAGSLNPRMVVWKIVSEPLRVHGLSRGPGGTGGTDYLRSRAEDLLEKAGMPRSAAERYPHEFSGGQRQRIGIARALALDPKFIVCDEPTSALDVSVQAQILNLLKDLQRDLGLSYLFISHDMGVVSHLCDRIAVMYAGQIVEVGERERVLFAPEHAYTKKLLGAVPEAPGLVV